MSQNFSTFPNGFTGGLNVRGVPINLMHPGKVFWVNNSSVLPEGGIAGSDTAAGTGTYLKPFRTLDYAIGRCKASRGDMIIVMPGHAETISAAAGVALDVAGVAILGLGTGALMPTFTMSATASTFAISAANTTVMNLRFVSTISDVVACITVTAANVTLKNLFFPDTGGTLEILTAVKATSTSDNNADGLWIEGCRAYSTSTAVLEFLEFNAQINGLVFKDNIIVNEGTAAGPAIAGATGKDLKNAYIGFNKVSTKQTANNLFIDSDSTASTGIVEENLVGHADVTTTHDMGYTGMGFRLFKNLSTSTASVSGFVMPAIDSDA